MNPRNQKYTITPEDLLLLLHEKPLTQTALSQKTGLTVQAIQRRMKVLQQSKRVKIVEYIVRGAGGRSPLYGVNNDPKNQP